MDAVEDPVMLLIEQFERATQVHDPCALYATLATVDRGGQPTTRTVSIQDIGPAGVAMFVNSCSPKGLQLAAGSGLELLMFWPSLLVQCRVRGPATLVQDDLASRAWRSKSGASRLADHYHATVRQQSTAVPSRHHLLQEVSELASRIPEAASIPASVQTLRVLPTSIELWIGSPQDRLHDRTAYEHARDGWQKTVLVP